MALLWRFFECSRRFIEINVELRARSTGNALHVSVCKGARNRLLDLVNLATEDTALVCYQNTEQKYTETVNYIMNARPKNDTCSFLG